MSLKRYALLGEHLGHSLSVQVHEALFRRMGLCAEYRLEELPRDGFAQRAAALLAGLGGANVTIPYKVEVMPLLSSLSPQAEAVGAVNTIVPAPGGLKGYNTDVAGFEAMLRGAGISPTGKACYILGTGGASLAVAAALREMGALSVTRVSRQPRGGDISYDQLDSCFTGLLVNTTPAGMKHFPADCPLSDAQLESLLPRATAVADVIYHPRETKLLMAAKRYGLPCCDGLTMLVAQALSAEELWQNQKLPPEWVGEIVSEIEVLLS